MLFLFRDMITWLRRARKGGAFVSEVCFAVRYVVQILLGRRRVIVVDRSAPGVGDLLCVAACLPSLREKHKGAWLVLVAAAQNQGLAAATHAADAVVVRESASYSLLLHRGFTLLAPLLPDEQYPPRTRPRRHLAAEFAAALEVPPPTSPCELRVQPGIQRRIDAALRTQSLDIDDFLVVHTGPSWRVKEWPNASWEILANFVRHRLGLRVVQIGTDMGSDLQARAAPRWPGAVDWVNRFTLVETAAIIARARMFIGIDSGPMHIACSLRRPIIGLFGPTDGNAFLFPSPFNYALHAALPCIGCHHDPGGPGHYRSGCRNGIDCMHALTPECVFAAISAEVQRAGNSTPLPVPATPADSASSTAIQS